MGGQKKGGLAFLNKKKWHTASIQNIEKVWIAEQKQREEQKKMLELQKQMQEERQIEELRRLQADAGLISKRNLNRLEWMYQGPAAVQQQQQEEYLLGNREFVPEKGTGEMDKVAKVEGALFVNKTVNTRLETEARMKEDPLLAILKEEKSQRDLILSNPVHMKKIKQKAGVLKKLRDAARGSKKKKKKSKKKKKKKSRNGDSSDDSESGAEQVENAKRFLRTHVERTVDSTKGQDRQRRRSRSRDRDRGRERSRRSDRDRSRRSSRSSRSRSSDRARSRDGSVGSRNSASSSSGYKRPRAVAAQPRRPVQKRVKLTEEEKKARLAQMMQDAKTHEENSKIRVKNLNEVTKREEEELRARGDPQEHRPSFIKKMNKEVYMSGNETLEGRLDKFKHYRQKGNIEHHSFL